MNKESQIDQTKRSFISSDSLVSMDDYAAPFRPDLVRMKIESVYQKLNSLSYLLLFNILVSPCVLAF